MITRIPLRYKKEVSVPKSLQKFLWDHTDKKAPLEKLILRTFKYGSYEQIKLLYEKYPDECFNVMQRHSDIKRGVSYWIKHWHGQIT